jgi:Domain of unknown function (DUF5666)
MERSDVMVPKLKFPSLKLLLAVFACATFLSAYLLVSAAQDQAGQGPGGGRQGGRFANLTRVSGTIDSIQPDSMVIKTDDGKMVTVAITSDTRFRRNRQEAKLSDFAKGDHVFVGAEPGSDSSKLTARFVGVGMGPGGPGGGGPPSVEQMQQMGLGTKFIAGEVKAIDETKLTILRPDGQTQIIQADENTSFQNDKRESVTLADIKVGDHVMGRGEMKSGIFVPSTLRVGMPHPPAGQPEQQPAK